MDDDDFALADSFINFDYVPDSDNIGSGSFDPDPAPVDVSVDERVDNVNVNVDGDAIDVDYESGEIIANDDAIEIDCEIGEIRGDNTVNVDANEVQIESSELESESEDESESSSEMHEEYELEEGEIVESDVGIDADEGEIESSESDELEEGEIVDSDVGVDDDRDGNSEDGSEESTRRGVDDQSQRRFVSAKNELENLPKVPPVNVNLGPHHQMLPLGVVTSIVGTKVIVEGMEKHDALKDGSILWITEMQAPLGLIDEHFGPVANPYYVVRFNSENEVPEGIRTGTLVSYVPEFANWVLNDKAEFSDGEKEAEYKRTQHTKRDPTNQYLDLIKNYGNEGSSNNGSILTMPVAPTASFVPQGHCPPIPGTGQGFFGAANGHCSPLPGTIQGFYGANNVNQRFPPVNSNPNLYTNGIWTNGGTLPPQQHAMPHSGFPPNGASWHPEITQISQHLPAQGIPFQQQLSHSPRFPPPPTIYPGGHPNMYPQGPINQNQWSPFSPIQPNTNFHLSHVSGNQGGPPRQFNPPINFHSSHVSSNQGGSPHQFNPPINLHLSHVSGNQGGPPQQFNPPANFHLAHVSSNQGHPPHHFNPPPQFHNQFNPGAYDGSGRMFPAGSGTRPFHQGGRGWRPPC